LSRIAEQGLIGSAANEGSGHLHGDHFTSCCCNPSGVHGRIVEILDSLASTAPEMATVLREIV
jgi:hypothetical protein